MSCELVVVADTPLPPFFAQSPRTMGVRAVLGVLAFEVRGWVTPLFLGIIVLRR